jgi:hypothetical protein
MYGSDELIVCLLKRAQNLNRGCHGKSISQLDLKKMKNFVFSQSLALVLVSWFMRVEGRGAYCKADSLPRLGEPMWEAVLLWRALVGHRAADGVLGRGAAPNQGIGSLRSLADYLHGV